MLQLDMWQLQGRGRYACDVSQVDRAMVDRAVVQWVPAVPPVTAPGRNEPSPSGVGLVDVESMPSFACLRAESFSLPVLATKRPSQALPSLSAITTHPLFDAVHAQHHHRHVWPLISFRLRWASTCCVRPCCAPQLARTSLITLAQSHSKPAPGLTLGLLAAWSEQDGPVTELLTNAGHGRA